MQEPLRTVPPVRDTGYLRGGPEKVRWTRQCGAWTAFTFVVVYPVVYTTYTYFPWDYDWGGVFTMELHCLLQAQCLASSILWWRALVVDWDVTGSERL